jgi:hypothetical protein
MGIFALSMAAMFAGPLRAQNAGLEADEVIRKLKPPSGGLGAFHSSDRCRYGLVVWPSAQTRFRMAEIVVHQIHSSDGFRK